MTRNGRYVLHADLDRIVRSVADYLIGTADVEREDRLCPGDLTVFETNPLSVAYGTAGVLHAIYQLTGEVPEGLSAWLTRRQVTNELYPPGLYMGQAGVAWVAGEIGLPEVALNIMRSVRNHELLFRSHDVLHGCAGYGLACLKMWMNGHGDEFLDDAVGVGDHLISSAVRSDHGVHWPGQEGAVAHGYAYGSSGVALFLLYLHLATGLQQPIDTGRQALDFDLAHGVWQDSAFVGFPAIVSVHGEDFNQTPRCYWDAGTAGVITTLVRYLAVRRDPSLEKWLDPLAANVSHKYAVMPQLFHGLAGLGNALIDIWEYTGNETHRAGAWQTAEGVLLFQIGALEGTGFPGEQAMRESADFASGAAGIGLFLDRLRKADPSTRGNFNFVLDELLPRRRPEEAVSATGTTNLPSQ